MTEARNAAGEEFGMDRLADVAARSNARTAEDTKNSVMTELMALTGGAFDDDSTLIVVEIVPPDAVPLEHSAC